MTETETRILPVTPYIGLAKSELDGGPDQVVLFDSVLCEHEIVMSVERARTLAASLMELLDARDL